MYKVEEKHFGLVKEFCLKKGIEEININHVLQMGEFAAWLEAAQLRSHADGANAPPDSVICGNCDASRMVYDWEVEDCQNCGDDGYSLLQDSPVP